jgi:hypothetical protein
VITSERYFGGHPPHTRTMFGQPGADHPGAAADKAKAVALAKYPGGTVNRVFQLSDGSSAVHMIKISPIPS